MTAERKQNIEKKHQVTRPNRKGPQYDHALGEWEFPVPGKPQNHRMTCSEGLLNRSKHQSSSETFGDELLFTIHEVLRMVKIIQIETWDNTYTVYVYM